MPRLLLQRVGENLGITHQEGGPLNPPVQETVGVRRAVRADPQDFQRLAVVQPPGHGPPGDGHADQFPVLGSAEGELAPRRGQVVPVVLGDELVGFFQVKWDGLHTGMYGEQPPFFLITGQS